MTEEQTTQLQTDIATINLEKLQFQTIFRNTFGVPIDALGMTIEENYTATANGHKLRLHVENKKVIGWKLDDTEFLSYQMYPRRTAKQDENRAKLTQALGI